MREYNRPKVGEDDVLQNLNIIFYKVIWNNYLIRMKFLNIGLH